MGDRCAGNVRLPKLLREASMANQDGDCVVLASLASPAPDPSPNEDLFADQGEVTPTTSRRFQLRAAEQYIVDGTYTRVGVPDCPLVLIVTDQSMYIAQKDVLTTHKRIGFRDLLYAE